MDFTIPGVGGEGPSSEGAGGARVEDWTKLWRASMELQADLARLYLLAFTKPSHGLDTHERSTVGQRLLLPTSIPDHDPTTAARSRTNIGSTTTKVATVIGMGSYRYPGMVGTFNYW